MPRHFLAPLERLLARSRVDPRTGCRLWLGCVDHAGYGRTIYLDRKGITAYRAMLASGREIPPGLELNHKCHVRRCIEPEHLEAVTHAQNLQDRALKATAPNCKRGHLRTYTKTGKLICKVCRYWNLKRWRYQTPENHAKVKAWGRTGKRRARALAKALAS